jgi:lipopolysaccharide export system protein LptC
VVRAPYGDKSELVVRTDYLHILPDDNIARTDQPVTITDANIVVNAIGLELNSETRILKLHSRVRGTYEQNKK